MPTVRVGAEEEILSRQVSDYSGEGIRIAVIDVGFDVAHPVFGTEPPSPALTAETAAEISPYPDTWISAKIPYAYDYADGDTDVFASSYSGTAAASLAAGCYIGQGDVVQEDGTVLHDTSFYGSAPDAQLLLMKAATDYSVTIQPTAAAAAVRDALLLGADVILLRSDTLSYSTELQRALTEASEANVPVLTGVGDVREKYTLSTTPHTYTDTGNIGDVAWYSTLTLVGSASDPYAKLTSFWWMQSDETEQEISYADSCREYFGKSFASLLSGGEYDCVVVPGVGNPEDFAELDVQGKIALILRGELSFTEKIQNAADAGAIAVCVINTEDDTVRMALEGAVLPAVMLSAEDGAALMESDPVRIRFAAREQEAAAHSATGVFRTLTRGVSFLAAGEGVTAAIPTDTSLPTPYAQINGTYYAAAGAAGYLARAMEFCAKADLPRTDAVPLAVQAAVQLEGTSPRCAGAGVLCDEGEYPLLHTDSSISDAVILPGESRYSYTTFPLTIRNTSDTKVQCTLSAELYRDAFAEEDGALVTDGTRISFTEGLVYLDGSSRNINRFAEEAETVRCELEPGKSITLEICVRIPMLLWREYATLYPNGLWVDGSLFLTDADGQTSTQPFTVFYGDWTKGALADVSVYDTESGAIFDFASLSVVIEDGDGFVRYPTGLKNPFSTENDGYEQRYQIVNPLRLRGGYTALKLCALREIDTVEIRVYDATGRCVFSRDAGSVEKYLCGGEAEIPLWDFIAADNDEYLFPDGTYECVVQLSSTFVRRKKTTQEMRFSFTVDSVRPEIVSYKITYTDTQVLLTVSAQDETALRGISVYDSVYSFPYLDESTALGETEGSRTFDITRHRYADTLYLEATDYADNYSVVAVKLTADDEAETAS